MPTIVQNISPALIEGATAIYIGGVRASALDASGNVLIDGNTTPPTQTAPTITAQPTISGTTAPTGLLTLAEGGASGNPVPTGTIQWYLDGVALIGENGLTIDKGQHGVGVYRATVIWANGVIPAATGQSNTITVAVQQTAPAITTQPSITGNATTGSVLTLAVGAASGIPAPTSTIQWLRGSTAISAATGTTYALVSGDVGQSISARVTWTNSAGSVQATSNTITVGVQQIAPTVTTQPTISGGTTVGDILTLAPGAATGTPTPTATYQWLRNGTTLSGEDSLTLDTGGYGAGAYSARVRWSNGVNPDAVVTTSTINVAVATTPAPGIDYSRALVYFDANTPFAGTASDVTAITSRGSAGLSLAKTGTAAIRRTAGGFVFADTGYVSASGIAAGAATDGMFLVVEFTQTSAGSNWARLSDGTGSRMRLQINSGSQGIIGTGADDTSVNIALGTATFGTRHVVAFEMDDVLNQLTGYDVSGASVGPIAHAGLTDPVNTRIDIGQFVNGTIHRWCLVGRTEGGAWPLTMAAVVADFRAGA
jgi:hypothetical protein